jgi:Dockerin type I domain
MNAQDPVCGTVSPTASQYQLFIEQAALENQLKGFNSSAAFTLNVPVRVTVILRQNGLGFQPTETEIDAMLSQASTAISKPNSTITFQRCAGITTFKSDKLALEQIPITTYSYLDFMTNVYILQGIQGFSAGTFPSQIPPSVAWIRGNDGAIANNSRNTIHELGHTIGLFHTHETANQPYYIPSTSNRADYPGIDPSDLNPRGRELAIRNDLLPNDSRTFKFTNKDAAGDRVYDTPPGCDDVSNGGWLSYAHPTNIAGCLDGNPATPCLNGCTDNDPATPCNQISACSFDRATCKYTGSYRDYNLDLVDDPNDVLVRNFMSYTDNCRNTFTTGQNDYLKNNFGIFLQGRNRIDVCGSMSDYVEWEGTNIPATSVRMNLITDSNPYANIRTVVNENNIDPNENGRFHAMLTSITPTGSVISNDAFKSQVVRYQKEDITLLDDSWLTGVDMLDVLKIQRHILNLTPLPNGYKMIAADVNKSNSITAADIALLRQLLLGAIQKFPSFDHPWLFIPETITHADNTTNTLQPDFDGVGDNPFNTSPPLQPSVSKPFEFTVGTTLVLGYLSKDFKCNTLRYNTFRNGFDMIKIGDVTSPTIPAIASEPEPCDETNAIVQNVQIVMGSKYDVEILVSNAPNISAFKLDVSAKATEFAWEGMQPSALPDTENADEFIGGLRNGGENIKLLWLKKNGSSTNMSNGQSLAKFRLTALKNITNAADIIKVISNYFVNDQGLCVSNVIIQINITPVPASDRGLEPSSINRLTITPNPLDDSGTVSFDAQVDDAGVLSFYDSKGALVSQQAVKVQKGKNEMPIENIGEFSTGFYSVILALSDRNYTTSFVKQN